METDRFIYVLGKLVKHGIGFDVIDKKGVEHKLEEDRTYNYDGAARRFLLTHNEEDRPLELIVTGVYRIHGSGYFTGLTNEMVFNSRIRVHNKIVMFLHKNLK